MTNEKILVFRRIVGVVCVVVCVVCFSIPAAWQLQAETVKLSCHEIQRYSVILLGHDFLLILRVY